MKKIRFLLACVATLALAVTGESAFADRGHGHGPDHEHGHHHGGGRVGVFVGAPVLGFGLSPFGFPGYAYGPYGYYGPSTAVIATPALPPTYVERSTAGVTGPASDGYWYYCHRPDGYYPYVRQCDEAWEQVPSQPVQR